MKRTVLCLNGSLGGAKGNTARLVREMKARMEPHVEWKEVHLGEETVTSEDLLTASAFVITTGTYWDSWGSPLQRFLEDVTDLEGTEVWVGKPVAVLVTMHSVGGKGVLSRLQGVFNTLGCWIPPMCGLAYSLAGHLALQTDTDFAEDFWQIQDLDGVSHNLLQAMELEPAWHTWPVDRNDPHRLWLHD